MSDTTQQYITESNMHLEEAFSINYNYFYQQEKNKIVHKKKFAIIVFLINSDLEKFQKAVWKIKIEFYNKQSR